MNITLEVVQELHQVSLREHGGLPGVREMGLLESAVYTPFSGFGDVDFYPEFLTKAAVLIRGIVQNHPFFDGNKRTGYLAMRYFLETNGYRLTATEDELYDFVIAIASGELEVEAISAWLQAHTVPRS